jgi:DNA-binding PucR family transcriptional regulator
MKQQFLYVLLECRSIDYDEIMEQKIAQVLGTLMLHAGISQRFSSFKDRARYIEQAEAALHAGTWTSPEKIVYTYKDHYSSIMLMAAVTSMARENLIPDELVELHRYDEENASSYTETLFAYLYERNDLNRAAARLHIHRNTMHYRMEKICQLLNIDPDEPQTALRLEIGFGIEKFLGTNFGDGSFHVGFPT